MCDDIVTDGCVAMSHKRSGLRGLIDAGRLDDTVPISWLPQKRIVLGGQAGSDNMRDWSRRELDGYRGAAAADSVFAAAIVGLRQHSGICRPIHGVVGDADYLSCLDDDEAAGLGSAKPVTLPAACTARRCRIALLTSFPHNRRSAAR